MWSFSLRPIRVLLPLVVSCIVIISSFGTQISGLREAIPYTTAYQEDLVSSCLDMNGICMTTVSSGLDDTLRTAISSFTIDIHSERQTGDSLSSNSEAEFLRSQHRSIDMFQLAGGSIVTRSAVLDGHLHQLVETDGNPGR